MARRLRRDLHQRISAAGYQKISGDLEVTGIIVSPTIDNLTSAVNKIVSGTTTPVELAITECKGGFKSIVLRWPKQYNLMNFDHYELQVSSDNATWYALKFDGTDWKGSLNGVTTCTGEMMVHVPIPFGGTEAAPTAVTLYYRVRQATILTIYGTWSDAVSATTSLLQNGDIAANVITANKILAAEINTLLLRATAAVIIGYAGSGTNASPAEGDRRAYIDDDELGLQVYTQGAWSTVRRITFGGVDSNGNFRPFLSCRGLVGDMDDVPLLDPIPDASFYRFNFDDNMQDQSGVDPWTINLGVPTYSTTKWEGTKSLTAAVNLLSAEWPTAWVAGASCTAAFMFRVTAAGMNVDILEFNAKNLDDCIEISLRGSGVIRVMIDKDGTETTSDTAFAVTTGTWHFFGFSYNAATNTAYVRLDGEQHSFQPTGTWGAATAKSIFLTQPGSGTYQEYMDDLILSPSAAIDPDLFFQHVTRGVAWTTDYYSEDLILKPRSGGRVVGSGGIWHVSQPPVLLASGAPAVGTYTITASVPDGTKAITWDWYGGWAAAGASVWGEVYDSVGHCYATSGLSLGGQFFGIAGVVPLDVNKQFKIVVGGANFTAHTFSQTGYYL